MDQQNEMGMLFHTRSLVLATCFLVLMLLPCLAMAIEPDAYEDDDKPEQSHLIFLSSEKGPQKRNFHQADDEDWVMFLGISGKRYTIEVSNLGAKCDPGLELYDTDSTTLLKGPFNTRLSFTFQKDGFYFVRVRNFDPDFFGNDTEYDLTLFEPFGDFPGHITGVVTNIFSGEPIAGVTVKISNNTSAETSDGIFEGKYYPKLHGVYYISYYESGIYDLNAQSGGHIGFSDKAEVKPTLTVEKNIALFRDFDGSGKTDMADAVMALQILAGIKSGLNENIRMEEMIGILKLLVFKKQSRRDDLFIENRNKYKDVKVP